MKLPDMKPIRGLSRGFTLVELMIALALGLLVTVGIISVFVSTSKAGNVQTQMARLQEEGRYAIGQIGSDLSMAGGLYGANTGGLATRETWGYMDGLRSPTAYVQFASLGLPDNAVALGNPPAAPYPLPSRIYVSGHECSAAACTPAVPVAIAPVMGTAAGNRVPGADVLTLRYVTGRGWSVVEGGSAQVCDATNNLTSIRIVPQAGDAPLASFQAGDLALLTDGSAASVFKVTRAGGVFTPSSDFPGYAPGCVNTQTDARLYNFSNDFTTITYYLQLLADSNPDAPAGHRVAALMRKVNGGPAEEIARGVERLDFRYMVENADGGVIVLGADNVAAGTDGSGNAIDCPVQPDLSAFTGATLSELRQGCLWRALRAIEVHALVDNATLLPALGANELAYRYSCDGSASCTNTGAALAPTALTAPLPNGLDKRMLRREFVGMYSVRNYNP
ncbi:MAG: PilW family protein [Metallibacterium sp.]